MDVVSTQAVNKISWTPFKIVVSGTAIDSVPSDGNELSSVVRDGVGVYTATFRKKQNVEPIVDVKAFDAAAKLFAVVSAVSVTGFTVKVFADDGTATDASVIGQIFFRGIKGS